jgi:uncharacterized SAM-binding protein YcdF (DUF218 family)
MFVLTHRLLRPALAAALILLLAAAFGLPRLGAYLVHEDPLQKADAIYVLGGTRFERPLEAVDLFREGWAPAVLLSRQVYDWGEVALRERGVAFPDEAGLQVDMMVGQGVPRAAITVLELGQDSTADESVALGNAVRRGHWRTVIVVTSKQHTRRAGLAMRRRLADTGVTVVMRASRYDRSDPGRWWDRRATLRFTLFETQRLIAYWVGLAD